MTCGYSCSGHTGLLLAEPAGPQEASVQEGGCSLRGWQQVRIAHSHEVAEDHTPSVSGPW